MWYLFQHTEAYGLRSKSVFYAEGKTALQVPKDFPGKVFHRQQA